MDGLTVLEKLYVREISVRIESDRDDPPRCMRRKNRTSGLDGSGSSSTQWEGRNEMIRKMSLLAAVAAVAALSGCATIAGGLVGTGVGLATGHPVSGAMIGTGVGMMIDTASRQSVERIGTD